MSRLRSKYPLGHTIKGKVTKINTHFLYFEVDQAFRVYVDVDGATQFLPCLLDDVELTNPKKFNSSTFTAVMGKDTIFKFPRNSQKSNDATRYIEFLKQNNFSANAEEIIAMDSIIRKLQVFLSDEVILLCIEALHRYALYDYKKSFKLVQSNVPKDLQLVNCNSELYTFLNFTGFCSFNVYPSKKLERVTDSKCDYLFGILVVSELHGYFTLQDDTSDIFVKFASSSESLHKYHNCVVLIKQYTAFTEMYELKTEPTLQYILLKVEDVVIVRTNIKKEEQKLFYGLNETMNANFKYSFYLQTSKVSEIIYGYNNSPECWVDGLIAPDENLRQFELVYCILPKELLKCAPYIKERVVYKIFTNQKLKYGSLASYKELYNLKQNKKMIILNSDTVFQETVFQAIGEENLPLENFQDIKSHIANTDDYAVFSFIFTIDRKEFQRKTYASWFPKRHTNVRYFGEMGHYQQRLIFRDAPTNSFIDLYLTNRENHVVPLGLVSNMKVKIKHVQVKKNKYLKATVFTGFEIIDYCPDIKFSSASLSFHDRNAWNWRKRTSPILLGLYAFIPTNCIVHGTVLFRALLDLRFNVVCDKCKQTLNFESCIRCKTKDKDVAVFMIIQAQDSINPTFHMEIDNIYFLMELVGLRNEKAIDAFFAECLKWPALDINFLKIPEEYKIYDADLYPVLQEIINMIRTQINYKFHFIMDAVCIKQVAEGRKPWKIIEFEFVS